MFLGPVILPEMPDPTVSECETLLSYANKLIASLQTVQKRLSEVSTEPDESLLLIQREIALMLADAKKAKSKLDFIKGEAAKKASITNQGQIMC